MTSNNGSTEGANASPSSSLKFIRNILVTGNIECLTGLHIGSGDTGIGIGGTDKAVILGLVEHDDRLIKVPIIPGSTLKGKMSALLELAYGKYYKMGDDYGKFHGYKGKCEDTDCLFCPTFGSGVGDSAQSSTQHGPTRLIVRDAKPTDNTIETWNAHEDIVHGTEIKAENDINRITSVATPRFIERVVAGSSFKLDMILSFYREGDWECLKLVLEGMQLLEDNFIGGSGSRGYGKIEFKNLQFKMKNIESYKKGDEWSDISPKGFNGELKGCNLTTLTEKLKANCQVK